MAEPATAPPPRDAARAADASDVLSRTKLAQGLTEVLSLPEGRQTANEQSFAAEILAAALRNASLGERVAVAERLASTGGAPLALLRELLLDEASVAEPLLRRLTVIGDPLLCEAAAVGEAHRMIIAGRDGLTEAVADALLGHGEASVAGIVLAAEVPLQPVRLDAVVALSRSAPALVPLLVARPDLQITHALTLFWWCDPLTRRRLLTRFSVDRTVMQDALQPLFAEVFTDPEADPVVRRLLHVVDRRHRPRGRDGEMVTMEVVERTLAVARAQPGAELCEAVGLLAGISTACATKVVADASGEPFAVLAKSIGVRRADFQGVLDSAAVIAPGEGPAATEAGRERMMACFDVISRDYARAALRYWDWRPDGAPPQAAPVASLPASRPSSVSGSEGSTSYLGAL